ncbi:hypothetical protein DRE_02249 [Drechslerella stenobrocha 248]|uniref:DUF4604 domain-containing protein n=1 Tax=Drechslerella stenobrocha 248 TaxID=1043628 RepID=W7IG53_9PEZI|nr:hypothetical protein DRE_02249 [Drechslerella stenobrocha 248]
MAHKNLSYESKEPAFLQRLRAQAAGTYRQPPSNRPKGLRNPDDDEEDQPVYVLEDNTTLSSKEFEALKDGADTPPEGAEGAEDQPSASGDPPASDSKDVSKKPEHAVLEVGKKVQKRKIAKVVGATTSSDEGEEEQEGKDKDKDKKVPARKTKRTRPKQKVKLSFGDD